MADTTDGRSYADTLDQMMAAFRMFMLQGPAMIPASDVKKVQRTLQLSDAAGPVLYPSEYKAGMDSLERQGKLVALYARTVADLKKLFPEDEKWLP